MSYLIWLVGGNRNTEMNQLSETDFSRMDVIGDHAHL